MRNEVRVPTLDPGLLAEAEALAEEIYQRHEDGDDYEEPLARLSDLAQVPLRTIDASGAFGSIASRSWARDLLLGRHPCPSDLSDAELVELIRAVCDCQGEDWQTSWWLRCIEASTGCAEVSDLIFYPQDVLGRDDLTPEEILAEARRRQRRVLVTPARDT
jgi:hypothetical protein